MRRNEPAQSNKASLSSGRKRPANATGKEDVQPAAKQARSGTPERDCDRGQSQSPSLSPNLLGGYDREENDRNAGDASHERPHSRHSDASNPSCGSPYDSHRTQTQSPGSSADENNTNVPQPRLPTAAAAATVSGPAPALPAAATASGASAGSLGALLCCAGGCE